MAYYKNYDFVLNIIHFVLFGPEYSGGLDKRGRVGGGWKIL